MDCIYPFPQNRNSSFAYIFLLPTFQHNSFLLFPSIPWVLLTSFATNVSLLPPCFLSSYAIFCLLPQSSFTLLCPFSYSLSLPTLPFFLFITYFFLPFSYDSLLSELTPFSPNSTSTPILSPYFLLSWLSSLLTPTSPPLFSPYCTSLSPLSFSHNSPLITPFSLSSTSSNSLFSYATSSPLFSPNSLLSQLSSFILLSLLTSFSPDSCLS